MPKISLRQQVPPECVDCAESESDLCPRLQDSRRPRRLVARLLRAARKKWPVIDGAVELRYSLPPDVATFVPTWDCNLRCPYCFQRDLDSPTQRQQRSEQMSLADWTRVIDELKPLGIPIIVMGGEWSLFRDALGLLEAIKRAGLALTLITNGTGLPALAEQLVRLRIDRVIVSVDGPAHIHNAIRGHPQAYDLAVAGIERVIASRGQCPSPIIQVSCTVSAYTQAHLREFVGAMAALGVDLIAFNNLIYATAEQVSASLALLQAVFSVHSSTVSALAHQKQVGIDATMVEQEMAAIRRGPWSTRTVMLPPGSEQHLAAYYAPGAPFFRNQRCGVIHRELWILPNGDVSACSLMTELRTGNVLESGVMVIWNGRACRELREYLTKGLMPACARCPKLAYHRPPADYSLQLQATEQVA